MTCQQCFKEGNSCHIDDVCCGDLVCQFAADGGLGFCNKVVTCIAQGGLCDADGECCCGICQLDSIDNLMRCISNL